MVQDETQYSAIISVGLLTTYHAISAVQVVYNCVLFVIYDFIEAVQDSEQVPHMVWCTPTKTELFQNRQHSIHITAFKVFL